MDSPTINSSVNIKQHLLIFGLPLFIIAATFLLWLKYADIMPVMDFLIKNLHNTDDWYYYIEHKHIDNRNLLHLWVSGFIPIAKLQLVYPAVVFYIICRELLRSYNFLTVFVLIILLMARPAIIISHFFFADKALFLLLLLRINTLVIELSYQTRSSTLLSLSFAFAILFLLDFTAAPAPFYLLPFLSVVFKNRSKVMAIIILLLFPIAFFIIIHFALFASQQSWREGLSFIIFSGRNILINLPGNIGAVAGKLWHFYLFLLIVVLDNTRLHKKELRFAPYLFLCLAPFAYAFLLSSNWPPLFELFYCYLLFGYILLSPLLTETAISRRQKIISALFLTAFFISDWINFFYN